MPPMQILLKSLTGFITVYDISTIILAQNQTKVNLIAKFISHMTSPRFSLENLGLKLSSIDYLEMQNLGKPIIYKMGMQIAVIKSQNSSQIKDVQNYNLY
jgi:hypothetical protein